MEPEPQPNPMQPLPVEAAGRWLPAAVLRHDGAAGGDHFDVLLAVRVPSGPDDAACATWRVGVDPADVAPGAPFRVEPIHAHRALYLTLREPRALEGGRGTVVPVREGSWTRDDSGMIEFRWNDGRSTRVTPLAMDLWRIER